MPKLPAAASDTQKRQRLYLDPTDPNPPCAARNSNVLHDWFVRYEAASAQLRAQMRIGSLLSAGGLAGIFKEHTMATVFVDYGHMMGAERQLLFF